MLGLYTLCIIVCMEGACTHLLSAHCSQFRIMTHNSPLGKMDTRTKVTWSQAETETGDLRLGAEESYKGPRHGQSYQQ